MTAGNWRCPSCQQGCAYCTGSEGEVPVSPEPGGPTGEITVNFEIGGTELAAIVEQQAFRWLRRNLGPGPNGLRAVNG